jgi:hypothetical protein
MSEQTTTTPPSPSPAPSPVGGGGQAQSDVGLWLGTIGLQSYAAVLAGEGYDCLSFVAQLAEPSAAADLESVVAALSMSPEEVARFRTGIAKLQVHIPSFTTGSMGSVHSQPSIDPGPGLLPPMPPPQQQPPPPQQQQQQQQQPVPSAHSEALDVSVEARAQPPQPQQWPQQQPQQQQQWPQQQWPQQQWPQQPQQPQQWPPPQPQPQQPQQQQPPPPQQPQQQWGSSSDVGGHTQDSKPAVSAPPGISAHHHEAQPQQPQQYGQYQPPQQQQQQQQLHQRHQQKQVPQQWQAPQTQPLMQYQGAAQTLQGGPAGPVQPKDANILCKTCCPALVVYAHSGFKQPECLLTHLFGCWYVNLCWEPKGPRVITEADVLSKICFPALAVVGQNDPWNDIVPICAAIYVSVPSPVTTPCCRTCGHDTQRSLRRTLLRVQIGPLYTVFGWKPSGTATVPGPHAQIAALSALAVDKATEEWQPATSIRR